jgi:hypothetical protein
MVQAIESTKIDSEHRNITRLRINMPDHTGAATIRNKVCSNVPRVPQQGAYIRTAHWICHAIGERCDVTTPQTDKIGEALPAGMPYTLYRIGQHQRMGRQAGSGHATNNVG